MDDWEGEDEKEEEDKEGNKEENVRVICRQNVSNTY